MGEGVEWKAEGPAGAQMAAAGRGRFRDPGERGRGAGRGADGSTGRSMGLGQEAAGQHVEGREPTDGNCGEAAAAGSGLQGCGQQGEGCVGYGWEGGGTRGGVLVTTRPAACCSGAGRGTACPCAGGMGPASAMACLHLDGFAQRCSECIQYQPEPFGRGGNAAITCLATPEMRCHLFMSLCR